MGDHMEDIEDTISLSGLQLEDNNNLSSSSSSSSRSSFDQEFSGFFSEEWSTTSPENIIFCGKIIPSKQSINSRARKADTRTPTSALYRSNSDSFRFMKTASWQSTPRSKSLPNRSMLSSSSCKSKWQVFMFGFGSGKFPTTMDMSDIKSRQLRRRSMVAVDGGKEESGGRRSGKKRWWRLVDVLGCSGGYERDTIMVI